MDTLNHVEVNKIRVRPLSEWNYLLAKTPPRKGAWPERSDLLCWWCCHSFTTVPAYLPVKVTTDMQRCTASFVFTGNFCSWNCVKRYAMMLQEHKKEPEGSFYVGMLAFITVSKGTPCEGPDMHDLGLCDCIDAYRGVRLPPAKEVLQSFGGHVDIQDYRRGFHAITDYNKVRRHFSEWVDVKRHALASPLAKFWGFQYLHYAGPDTSCTTYVDILPLTNRTFNRTKLVRTGNEALHRATPLNPNPIATTATHMATTAGAVPPTDGNGNGNDDKGKPKPSRPRGRPPKISRQRGSQQPPVEISSTNNDAHDRAPPHRTRRAMMTNEQVLACNEEQQFYTNSLRGFGNILTSMGIEIIKK